MRKQYKHYVSFGARTKGAIGLGSKQEDSFISNQSKPSPNIRDTDGFLSLYDRYDHINNPRLIRVVPTS